MTGFLVALALSGDPPKTAANGPFRLTVREVMCRRDFGQPEPTCEIGLDLHWESPLAVVRVAQTGLTGWTPNAFPVGKSAVTGTRHRTTVRLMGVKRTVLTVPRLESTFTVTAADQLVSFTLPDLTSVKPQTQAGVTLTPRPPRRLDGLVELRLELQYPAGHPEFESFESWTAGNRCRLVHRDGRTLTTEDYDTDHSGRRATAAYRFKAAEVGGLAGWSMVYDTPGPLRELPVRFTLTDIPLP